MKKGMRLSLAVGVKTPTWSHLTRSSIHLGDVMIGMVKMDDDDDKDKEEGGGSLI